MTMQDPIADMITRIRNSQQVSKKQVSMPLSKIKMAILKVLHDEGYIENYTEDKSAAHPTLVITLKYHEGRPVIERFQRVSRPGSRIYKMKEDLPYVDNGLGTAIVSTSHGVMSDKMARKNNLGGEVLCYVS